MKLIIKKYYSTDQRCLVESRQRRDGLWEVEGFARTTETLPDEGSYTFMEPAMGQVLTDTLSNAEKLALETLSALSGVSRENMTYHSWFGQNWTGIEKRGKLSAWQKTLM